MKKAAEANLIHTFRNKSRFSRKDLLNYFLKTEGELNEGTFGWRIYELKQKGILQELKRGWYTLNAKPVYTPEIDGRLTKMAEFFTSNFRKAEYCIWHTNWLNEFTTHQFFHPITLFETEKDLQDALGNSLIDQGYPNVLWSLKGEYISVSRMTELILIRPLISRAPVQQVSVEKKVSVPTLEKILVDIYKDEKILYFIQGAEMERIFKNAINRYAINWTTFFAYAARRGKTEELRTFISNHFPELLKTRKR